MAYKSSKCPSCGSYLTDVVAVRNDGFSAGKAVLGTALFGPLGGAVGGFSGEKKTTYKCQKCGRTFEV